MSQPSRPQDSRQVDDDVPSSVYAILPAMIQSRIPRLKSLRRTVTGFRPRPLLSPVHARCANDHVPAGAQTPPPSYTSRPPSSAAMRRGSGVSVQSLSDETLVDEPPLSSSSAATLPGYHPLEMPASVNWKFARQGLSLLSVALQDCTSPSGCDSETPFGRTLYMQALTLLLKGLPCDLSTAEKMSIETSLPPDIVKVVHVDVSSGQLLYHGSQHVSGPHRPPPEPSWLHRLLASSIIQAFLLLHLLLPYVKLFVGHAYHYERQHRISERLVSSSINTVDGLGRTSFRFTNAIFQMNDGKVGQAINDLTLWGLRGVTGGIHEGLSEGITLLGTRSDDKCSKL
ncbi:ubiquitin-conjugating enzyme [Diplodia corticola]|uniref:Ubiquitin-conjugating enzyme n=1 Tax=Diplodia corticola TaxID=236234 RepID=A0A1J9RBG2_9PEZI|nr:ubiquitin-conjugating enzyme [Diplodia corticola]OJD29771.1 ubiquitin-conjugating enzyme [Diplodia corticola]